MLDGQLSTFSGNVVINGDYIQLKHITLSGDLLISDGVKNSFTTDALTIEGKTEIKSASRLASNAQVSFANTKTRIKIVFNNSKVAVIEISKKDIELLAKGETTITSLALSTDANIFADDGVIFQRIELKNGATEVQLNVTIKEIIIESNEEILLTGRGNIETITINSDKKVAIQTTGQIGMITAINNDTSLAIGENTQVKNLTLPEGKTALDVIVNYESIKWKVENIGGSANPDYTPPFVGGAGSSAPPVEYFDAGILKGSSYGYTRLSVKNQKVNTNVYFELVKFNGEETRPPAVVGSKVLENMVLSENKEFILWGKNELYVYQVDDSGEILDAVNVEVHYIWDDVNVKLDYANRSITIESQLEKTEGMITVKDMFNQVFIYHGEEFYEFKQNQLNLINFKINLAIPSFTIEMPVEMTEGTNYISFINTKVNGNYYSYAPRESEFYESTTMTVLKKLSYNPDIVWQAYAIMLQDYLKDDSGSSQVKFSESHLIKYRELISKGDSQKTLNSRTDFIDLVEIVNAELK